MLKLCDRLECVLIGLKLPAGACILLCMPCAQDLAFSLLYGAELYMVLYTLSAMMQHASKHDS